MVYCMRRTATTDVCITLSQHFRQVSGYPYISGQNIYFYPILYWGVTSNFMFWTYQSFKKLVWVSSGGGGVAR